MNINYNVTGSDRQKLVRIISRETGEKAHYEGAPSMAYTIGGFTVSREGALSWADSIDRATVLRIATAIEAEGLKPEQPINLPEEPETTPSPSTDEAPATEEAGEGLTISLPMDGFNPDSLDRLQKLVDSKASLIQKALGAQALTIRIRDGKVEFPWWTRMPEPEELQAYMAFIANLSAMAKVAKRVVATEKPVESEKFAFRVWLLRLGFNGAEYKAQRATLLKNLSGPAAFPNQAAADAFGAAQKEKRSATKVADSSDGLKPAQITAAVSKLAAQVSAMEEEVEA